MSLSIDDLRVLVVPSRMVASVQAAGEIRPVTEAEFIEIAKTLPGAREVTLEDAYDFEDSTGFIETVERGDWLVIPLTEETPMSDGPAQKD